LLLNGQELSVNEPRNAVVRDLTVTAAGIVSRKTPTEQRPLSPRRKQAAAVQTQPSPTAAPQQTPSVSTSQPPKSVPPLPPAPGKMPKRPSQ
jgi:hypothetical protein